MDKRIIKTKKTIRDAFSNLIKEKKFSDITVSELCKKAIIDRNTFYAHYSTLIDIPREIEKEAVEELGQKIGEADFNITTFFETLNQILMSNYEYYQCITSEACYYSFQKECKNILKSIIIKKFNKNSNFKKSEFDYYSEYVTSGIMGMYIQWINKPDKEPIEYFTEIAKKALLEKSAFMSK